jgi:hypothetical protein
MAEDTQASLKPEPSDEPSAESGEPSAESGEPSTESAEPSRRTVGTSARRAIDAIRSGVSAAADGVAAAAEPLVDRVQEAIEDAERTWHERPGARVRRVRRMGAHALPNLYELHPEARKARPVQVGLRTIDVADIGGTAVGGGDQRGGDFLPLKPFRGKNWSGRWQRLRQAQDRLAILPPIDVVKYADRYWVDDGHNRVALALYGGQVGIDASVVELVPMGATRTEPVGSLAATAADSRSVRTAGSGHRPSVALSRNEPIAGDPPDLES